MLQNHYNSITFQGKMWKQLKNTYVRIESELASLLFTSWNLHN